MSRAPGPARWPACWLAFGLAVGPSGQAQTPADTPAEPSANSPANLPVLPDIPAWALTDWHALQARQPLRHTKRLSPPLMQADFNGDGRADVALHVVDRRSGKEGIAFLLRGQRPLVLGAGQPFGNGGDDFSWMDLWRVTPSRRACQPNQTPCQADLWVEKEASASARIRWRGRRPEWRQMGD